MLFSSAIAATVVGATAPAKIRIQSVDEEYLLPIDGREIQFCNQSNFSAWAESNLTGNKIAYQGQTPFININGKWSSVEEMMVRNGYLYDTKYTESLYAAAAERKGEWACARKDAIFQMVLKSKNNAKIVAAVAMNESQYKGYPWPWTLNVQGKSLYFKTREEAHEKILTLLSQGIKKIDIGITQIHWKFHSHRFSSPWEALDVSANINASESIITLLYKRHGDLGIAIRCYHNCVNVERGTTYLNSFTRHLASLEL